jgi:hypothetical protein
LLAGLTAWQMGYLGGDGRPLAQLRQRLGIGPATTAPSRPAGARPSPAPTTPAPPSAPPAPPVEATTPLPPAPAVPPAASAPAAPSAPSALTPEPSRPGTPPSAPRPVASVTTPAPPAPAAPGSPAAAGATPRGAPPAASPRFAIEFGPFVTTADAERVERQLTQAGYQTARFRQSQSGAGLYAVLLERVPAGRDAQAVVAALREQGFTEPSVIGQDPPVIRLAEPLPLRGAVEVAERARGLGHAVRVAAQPGEAVAFMIRHGSFASRQDAAAKAEELGRLGLAHQVIQVR